MRIGILGYPQSGKTTLFNLLASADVEAETLQASAEDADDTTVVQDADAAAEDGSEKKDS